jgi:hypothetical protein
MALLPFRTSTYALNIYRFGTYRLTPRDGYPSIADGYYDAVEQYAALNFYRFEFDEALKNGWINQQEYDETLAYLPAPTTGTTTTDAPNESSDNSPSE